MIRSVCLLSLAAAATFAASSPARADVIEIGSEGARWVSGGAADRSGVLTVTAAVTAANRDAASVEAQLPADLTVPMGAVANTAIPARSVPEIYAATVNELSGRYDLSVALLEALVWQESRWNARAISRAGARGLGQLMPGTAAEMGVNPDDPFANLEGTARYLRIQLDRFDGDLELALAAYNAGPARVIRAGGVPRIRETQHYVAAILGRLSNYSRRDN